MTGLLARVLALFFVAALADVPLICPEEQAGAAATFENATPEFHVAAFAAKSFSVAGSTAPDSDCGCPCHHTFGGTIAITLSPLVRLPESPDQPAPAGISPPIRSPEHPPQNLG